MKHDEMEALGKKKWQVAVQLAKVEYYAIWATDPDEAGRLVVQASQGVKLGEDPTKVLNVGAREIDPRKTDEEVTKEVAQAVENPKPKSLIQVVSG